ncbi:hypothetical protein Acr_25g0004150 [Actinidia rufa]|uniref:Uncharacterized protein n=1 Tax=Actinidia rufa TaxID=165716 RepID=A0A7J0GYX1_9ERIC|nr:hypothetical protein Acr_25g0004150 [Actinidia rufa]
MGQETGASVLAHRSSSPAPELSSSLGNRMKEESSFSDRTVEREEETKGDHEDQERKSESRKCGHGWQAFFRKEKARLSYDFTQGLGHQTATLIVEEDTTPKKAEGETVPQEDIGGETKKEEPLVDVSEPGQEDAKTEEPAAEAKPEEPEAEEAKPTEEAAGETKEEEKKEEVKEEPAAPAIDDKSDAPLVTL